VRRIDANIILRFLTNEPLHQAERAARLFAAIAAGHDEVLVEDVVLAEVVWTLASFYRMTKTEIATALLDLMSGPGMKNADKQSILLALVLYQEKNIDFADALLAAKALTHDEPEIYSFDRDFDRVPGLKRREPD
jgi:predicted nucleic acid-binding protein